MRILRPLAAALAAVCLFALPASARIAHRDRQVGAAHDRLAGRRAALRLAGVDRACAATTRRAAQFTPFRMEKDHFSREWDDAPMPHSIFFTTRGHAIHGTEHTRNIGRPASHGCVRLEPENARVLFDLVKQEGMANVRVVLSGATGRAGRRWCGARRSTIRRAMTTTSPARCRARRRARIAAPRGTRVDRRRLPAHAAATAAVLHGAALLAGRKHGAR